MNYYFWIQSLFCVMLLGAWACFTVHYVGEHSKWITSNEKYACANAIAIGTHVVANFVLYAVSSLIVAI